MSKKRAWRGASGSLRCGSSWFLLADGASGDFGDVVVGIELRPEAGRSVDGGIETDLVDSVTRTGNGNVDVQEIVQLMWTLDDDVEALGRGGGAAGVVEMRVEQARDGLAGSAIMERTEGRVEFDFRGNLTKQRVVGVVAEEMKVGIDPDAGFGRERFQHDVETVVDERGRRGMLEDAGAGGLVNVIQELNGGTLEAHRELLSISEVG